MAEPRPRPPGSEEDLTQWQFVESDRPFVTKFPDQHRVALPGEPFVVVSASKPSLLSSPALPFPSSSSSRLASPRLDSTRLI